MANDAKYRGMELDVGQVIGEWTIIEKLSAGSYKCRCSCGTERIVKRSALLSGKSKSCGHNSHVIDLTGKTFGELTPLKYIGNKKWLCRCSCGKELEVKSYDLSRGIKTSCGHGELGGKIIDLRGQKFGELTAIKYEGNSMWLCKCSCGKEKVIHRYSLLTGATRSCGHLALNKREKLEGMTFGELTVLRYLGYKHYRCRCSCGREVTVLGANLKSGGTRSCGCKTKELMFETMLKRYGDITTWKINNPRETWVIETFNNCDKLQYFLESYIKLFKRKPTLTELGEIFSVHRTAVKLRLEKYELIGYIEDTNGTSEEEIILFNYISDLCNSKGYKIIGGDRKILEGKELDIYIPDEQLAIEYNGSYWHSILYKDRMYHFNKTIECAKKGVRLIHVFDYEYFNDSQRKKVETFLSGMINHSKKMIYARDCNIKEIDESDAKQFIDQYHLQGHINSAIRIGIYYNNELIGVTTFGKPRFNTNYQYELLRLCWKNDVAVIGGAEKLFKYFITHYNPSSIVSYCDISKFSGSVYKRLGFKFNGCTDPNYRWVDTANKRSLSRYQTTKQQLVKLGLGNEEQTEDEIMSQLGYYKVYDCGNAKYTWSK